MWKKIVQRVVLFLHTVSVYLKYSDPPEKPVYWSDKYATNLGQRRKFIPNTASTDREPREPSTKGILLSSSYQNMPLESQGVRNFEERTRLLELTEGFYGGKWKKSQYEIPCGGNHYDTLPTRDKFALAAAHYAMSGSWWTKTRIYTFIAGFFGLPKPVGLKRIVRVNVWHIIRGYTYKRRPTGHIFCLTLKGTDDKFYEAKVYRRGSPIFGRFVYMDLYFIRPAIYYPLPDPNILHPEFCNSFERALHKLRKE